MQFKLLVIETPIKLSIFDNITIIASPNSVLSTPPSPPERLVPPIITVAIVSKRTASENNGVAIDNRETQTVLPIAVCIPPMI